MLFETPLSETCTGTARWLRNFHYGRHKGKCANDMKIFHVLSESLENQEHCPLPFSCSKGIKL